jgi:hypothetical protein
MVMISRAPSKWGVPLQFVDQREGFAFLHADVQLGRRAAVGQGLQDSVGIAGA